jgi:putative Mg2+ transporter-C (MgtC) family protein
MQAAHNSFPVLDQMLRTTVAGTVGAVLQRLIIAAALGGAIGVEREMKHRPAGLRTNMFLCFGAALFTMLSLLMAGPGGQDQTRIASQIIAGIGFIGAGSILHPRSTIVHGVTTAATIFVVAAIGMCTGAGMMIPAALATGLVLIGLFLLGLLERHIFVHPYQANYEATAGSTGELDRVLEQAREGRLSKLVDVKLSNADQATRLEFVLEAQPKMHHKLRQTLHDAFDSRRILSFRSSEQE